MFEKFIALFERAVVALEKIAATPAVAAAPAAEPAAAKPARAAKTKEAPAPEAPAPKKDAFLDEEPPAKKYEKGDVRAALVKASEKIGGDKAQALLKQHGGVETLGALTEDKYAAVIAAAESAVK